MCRYLKKKVLWLFHFLKIKVQTDGVWYCLCLHRVFWDIWVMSVISPSLQLDKGFRQYWLPQKLEGRGLLARFNLTSHPPKFMHIALQVSVQVKSACFCAQAITFHQNKCEREKINSAKCLCAPKNWVGEVNRVVGDKEQSLNTCTFCFCTAASNR